MNNLYRPLFLIAVKACFFVSAQESEIDNFIFEGSKESVRKQIGMAVPVKGAKIIFDSILKTFAGIYYPSINE